MTFEELDAAAESRAGMLIDLLEGMRRTAEERGAPSDLLAAYERDIAKLRAQMQRWEEMGI